MTFGEKVKNLRKNKGLNQTQLADAVGVEIYFLSRFSIIHKDPETPIRK